MPSKQVELTSLVDSFDLMERLCLVRVSSGAVGGSSTEVVIVVIGTIAVDTTLLSLAGGGGEKNIS